jgi:hypothetical protein
MSPFPIALLFLVGCPIMRELSMATPTFWWVPRGNRRADSMLVQPIWSSGPRFEQMC